MRERYAVEVGVFGDIDLQPHRDWVESVCAGVGLRPCLPLWREPRRRLLEELLGQGVHATIVAVDGARLDKRFLGRRLDPGAVAELEEAGVDACGEEGEFHTVVTHAPLFRSSVALTAAGTLSIDNYHFIDLEAPVRPEGPGHMATRDRQDDGNVVAL